MIAGALRHRVTIETIATDDGWGSAPNSTPQQTRYASITELSGREAEIAKQINAEVAVKVVMRTVDISPRQVITFEGRTFHVISVINERGITTTCMCKEKL